MIIYYDTILYLSHRPSWYNLVFLRIEVSKPLVIQGFVVCLDLRLSTVLKGACLSTSLLSLL